MLHGYKDRWENHNVFSYTGEGQSGDMEFVRGNLALKDHVQNGRRVFLFHSVARGLVRFEAEVVLFNIGMFETHDTSGDARVGIKFFFQRAGSKLPVGPSDFSPDENRVAAFDILPFKKPNRTERLGLVTSRVGQGAFRESIIHRWEYQCAVTGFNKLRVLIASHIVPWSKASDEQRLDVNNGILLSPVYDALFDRHLISFENDGSIILSNEIEPQAYQKIGVSGKEKISGLQSDNLYYLEQHRLRFDY